VAFPAKKENLLTLRKASQENGAGWRARSDSAVYQAMQNFGAALKPSPILWRMRGHGKSV
jgi:hypothetical protein